MTSRRHSSIVLFSGGLDSTVALYWALRRRNLHVRPMTFDYFRRSRREADASSSLLKHLGLKPISIELPFMKEVSDMKKINRNKQLQRAPSAYVPCRNVVLYGIASSFAEVLDCKYIIGGHNREDAMSFPDSSTRFFQLFNNLTLRGLYTKDMTSRVILPLSRFHKSDVVILGQELGVPFELTWSCYYSNMRPCGKCHSCKLRKSAFASAGIFDPLLVRANS